MEHTRKGKALMFKRKERDDSYQTIDCDVTAATPDAILVQYSEEDDAWVPRSQVRDGDTIEEGDDQRIEIKTWFCNKVGIAQ